MSDLQPKGVAIEVGGAERHLLFTIAVVDELQSKYNMPISQVMSLLSDAMQSPTVVADIMLALINDEIRRNRHYHHSDEKEIPEDWCSLRTSSAASCPLFLSTMRSSVQVPTGS